MEARVKPAHDASVHAAPVAFLAPQTAHRASSAQRRACGVGDFGSAAHAEIALRDLGRVQQLLCRARQRDAAVLEDIAAIGDRQRLARILLGQQDRDALLRAGRRSDGRSRRPAAARRRATARRARRIFGFAIRPARNGQHLLLPAGEIAGEVVHALAQDRKQPAHRGSSCAAMSASGRRIGAEREIFARPSCRRRSAAPPAHARCRGAAARAGDSASIGVAVEQDRAGHAGASGPRSALASVDLPAPLAPTSVTISPRSSVRSISSQHAVLAVADRERFKLKQRHRLSRPR